MIIKRYNGNARVDTVSNGIYTLYAIEGGMEVGPDGSPIFVYKTKAGFDIPEGCVGIVLPASGIETKSFTFMPQVIPSGDSSEVILKFKLNTISIPHMYQTDEPIAHLIVVPSPSLDVKWVDEIELVEKQEEQPISVPE